MQWKEYKEKLGSRRKKREDRSEVSEDSDTADARATGTDGASITSRYSPAAALFTSLGDASTHRVTEEYARLEHNRKRDAGRAKRRDVRNAARAKRRDVRNAARIASDDESGCFEALAWFRWACSFRRQVPSSG